MEQFSIITYNITNVFIEKKMNLTFLVKNNFIFHSVDVFNKWITAGRTKRTMKEQEEVQKNKTIKQRQRSSTSHALVALD